MSYVSNHNLGDLTPAQTSQLAAAKAFVDKWEPILATYKGGKYANIRAAIPIQKALILKLTQTTAPTPPTPTTPGNLNTTSTTPTPVWVDPVAPSTPVSVNVTSTTSTPETTPAVKGVSKTWLIGGGLLLLLLLRR